MTAPHVSTLAQHGNFDSFTAVTVGVSDLEAALGLWVGELGLSVVFQSDDADDGLEGLWNLEPGDIARQALLQTQGSDCGLLHLVEFNNPAAPVRAGAQNFDQLPKNLDILVTDLPAKFADLKAKGYTFRTETFSEVTAPDGTVFREVHLLAPDNINVVLVEVFGNPRPFTAKGASGIGPLVLIVPDFDAEISFFRDVMGMEQNSHNVLKGPEIEKMVGLPKGTALNIGIWGRKGVKKLADLEIIEYQGVAGNNLYPLAKPKALGVLHLSYFCEDFGALRQRVERNGTAVTTHGRVDSPFVTGEAFSFKSPAGITLQIFQV